MVTDKKIKDLDGRMKKLNIREDDIVEKFTRGSGKGGQKINKTSSCVYIKHIPTGISVKCSSDRAQSVNRFLARRILTDKIDSLRNKAVSDLQKKIYKMRKQKRKRSKKAKEKILRLKRIVSEKKALRVKPKLDD
ncbi:MAG: peptide chain release factor-like protein [bacterium]